MADIRTGISIMRIRQGEECSGNQHWRSRPFPEFLPTHPCNRYYPKNDRTNKKQTYQQSSNRFTCGCRAERRLPRPWNGQRKVSGLDFKQKIDALPEGCGKTRHQPYHEKHRRKTNRYSCNPEPCPRDKPGRTRTTAGVDSQPSHDPDTACNSIHAVIAPENCNQTHAHAAQEITQP